MLTIMEALDDPYHTICNCVIVISAICLFVLFVCFYCHICVFVIASLHFLIMLL